MFLLLSIMVALELKAILYTSKSCPLLSTIVLQEEELDHHSHQE